RSQAPPLLTMNPISRHNVNDQFIWRSVAQENRRNPLRFFQLVPQSLRCSLEWADGALYLSPCLIQKTALLTMQNSSQHCMEGKYPKIHAEEIPITLQSLR
uniref:Uncharacterized protein n=1 Tax=Callorhinchus milii TaxID=7868 RepID=A0A4W3JJ56_CALMI